jgi:hypothetical protein
LTRFYFGAIHYLNVEQFTLREVSELLTQMQRAQAEAQD